MAAYERRPPRLDQRVVAGATPDHGFSELGPGHGIVSPSAPAVSISRGFGGAFEETREAGDKATVADTQMLPSPQARVRKTCSTWATLSKAKFLDVSSSQFR